uniref:Uncharacterized protein n=1 Tax=Rhizophora mucronata TaxID=61149 RepID=A0A2P2N3X9_RHIMU
MLLQRFQPEPIVLNLKMMFSLTFRHLSYQSTSLILLKGKTYLLLFIYQNKERIPTWHLCSDPRASANPFDHLPRAPTE